MSNLGCMGSTSGDGRRMMTGQGLEYWTDAEYITS